MRINTNVSSLNAQESAVTTSKNLASSLEKLSSGLRINKASDDASGLAIADKLRTQATSIGQGISNGNSAIALLQIADKSMGEQSNILDSIKSKLVQANTDTTSDAGRESIRKDINKLLTQLDNIAAQTNYNGKSLLADVQNGKLTGKGASALNFQIGAASTDIISTAAINSTSASLGGGKASVIAKVNGSSSETLSNVAGGTLTVAATSGALGANTLDINVTGNLGKLTNTGTTGLNLIVNSNDTATISKLKALISAGNFTQGSFDNVFTLKQTSNVDLSNVDLSNVEIKDNAAAKKGSFTATGDSFKIANNDLTNSVTVTSSQVVSKGQTTVVSSTDTTKALAVKQGNSGQAINLTVSGNLGQLTIAATGSSFQIEATNDADKASLQKLITDGMTGVSKSGDKFAFAIGATYNLGDLNLSNAKITMTAGLVTSGTFTTNSSSNLSITNNGSADITLNGIDAKGGNTLASLKNLGENSLTANVATSFQSVVDDAITQLNGYRGDIGSTQNQAESAVRNLATQQTNIKAAESIIRDVDYAAESANFNKQNIISQAGSYAMSQANSVQQSVLKLLQ